MGWGKDFHGIPFYIFIFGSYGHISFLLKKRERKRRWLSPDACFHPRIGKNECLCLSVYDGQGKLRELQN